MSPTIPPTNRPSISPTKNPTNAPSIPAPSIDPTLAPTKPPTTKRPTRSPIRYSSSPTRTPTAAPTDKDELEQLKETLLGLTYVEIGIIGGVLLCIIISCCVFCKWQRNRVNKLSRTHGMSTAQRKAQMRKKNMERRLELQKRRLQQQQLVQQRGTTHQLVRQMSPASTVAESQGFIV